MNERFSGTGAGTAFGDGVYLAEDAGKTVQYISADSAYDPSSELHKWLYSETVPHPDDVFYVLVVRAAYGRGGHLNGQWRENLPRQLP